MCALPTIVYCSKVIHSCKWRRRLDDISVAPLSAEYALLLLVKQLVLIKLFLKLLLGWRSRWCLVDALPFVVMDGWLLLVLRLVHWLLLLLLLKMLLLIMLLLIMLLLIMLLPLRSIQLVCRNVQPFLDRGNGRLQFLTRCFLLLCLQPLLLPARSFSLTLLSFALLPDGGGLELS